MSSEHPASARYQTGTTSILMSCSGQLAVWLVASPCPQRDKMKATARPKIYNEFRVPEHCWQILDKPLRDLGMPDYRPQQLRSAPHMLASFWHSGKRYYARSRVVGLLLLAVPGFMMDDDDIACGANDQLRLTSCLWSSYPDLCYFHVKAAAWINTFADDSDGMLPVSEDMFIPINKTASLRGPTVLQYLICQNSSPLG